MKSFIAITLITFACLTAAAQTRSDSLAYQLQRKKINSMLAQRRQKFGQYDQSLSMHTGIFGLQTKKDIRRSNDILMDIVKTDEAIFGQLKILLDYRAFEQTQVQTRSAEVQNSTTGYMNTINKLRDQLDKTNAQTEKEKGQLKSTNDMLTLMIILLVCTIILLILQASRLRRVRRKQNAALSNNTE